MKNEMTTKEEIVIEEKELDLAVRYFETGNETERFATIEEAEQCIDTYVDEDGDNRDDWEIYDLSKEEIIICKHFDKSVQLGYYEK